VTGEGGYPYLVSANIYLRALEQRDVSDRYVRWLNDPEIRNNVVAGNFPQGYDSIREFVASMRTPHAVSFAICLKAEGAHVGNVALRHIDWTNRQAEVGILVGEPSVRGRGVASEAVDLVCRYAFETLKLRRVWTGTTNPIAAKLFLRLGWRAEGALRAHALVGGEWRDTQLFGLLAEEYRGVSPSPEEFPAHG
jgi:RimJ/RimL family protein N-acetyltransferase